MADIDVPKVARLARLDLPEAEMKRKGGQIKGILSWVEQLAEVNTDGVEPLANVADIELILREDEVTDGDDSGKVLANAPEAVEDFYVVPKVVE
jgi:aspartyl-tRNA(Asn)/glutamyl-tRNA(Gln) amidotransferase subunit C